MTQIPAKHRHPVDGGYARGEETRTRIVAAALTLFGERGFDSASTRDIADRAGVNAPALRYYFDNKEGVYLACAEHIAGRTWEYIAEPVQAARAALDSKADDEALMEAYCAIQMRIAEFLFVSNETVDWRLFMAREQAELGPAAGFDIINERVNRRTLDVTAAIVGRLLGRPADDEQTLLHTISLSGPLVIFHITRRSAALALGWDVIDADRLARLMHVINGQTMVMLRSMTLSREAAAGQPGATRGRRSGGRA